MKASEAIKWLNTYNPDEELIIAWWDKHNTGFELTDEQWQTVVDNVDKSEWAFAGVTECIDDTAYENGYKHKEWING